MAIDSLKSYIKQNERTTKEIIGEINLTCNWLVMTKETIKETLLKTDAAKRDRQELYRDLATFEFNFSKRNKYELFHDVDGMCNAISDIVTHFNDKGYV